MGGAALVTAQRARVQPGTQPDGSILVTSNQSLTPIGVLRQLAPARPKDLTLSPDRKTVAVLTTTRVAFFGIDGMPQMEVPLTGGALGIAWAPDGNTLYASGADGKVFRLAREG
ncbi:MAG TPA: hypothetical protein VFU47_08995, partial [Armatimonadota bacterium]|nr:hypothetical protein [Armatimonadota bacterium]